MSITIDTQQAPCPDWCQSDHGATAPERIRHLYTAHTRNTGGVGNSWVDASVEPAAPDLTCVSLTTYKDGRHSSLNLSADEARALALAFDPIESDNAATLANALRKAADLIAVPAAGR